jgi:hypothetical protein
MASQRDAAGCESLLALLGELPHTPEPYRTLSITPPTSKQWRVPKANPAWVAPSRLRLAWSVEPAIWDFPAELDPAVLTFGVEWLGPLRNGVASIREGRGDYAIGTGKGIGLPLWFWW